MTFFESQTQDELSMEPSKMFCSHNINKNILCFVNLDIEIFYSENVSFLFIFPVRSWSHKKLHNHLNMEIKICEMFKQITH